MSKQKFTIKLSKYARTGKPDIIEEWHDLSDIETKEWTVKEIATAVGEWGHSFSHGTFDGDIRYDNFQSAHLMVVDIDDKRQVFHPGQALERLREHGLDCNIMYRTFSDPTPDGLADDELLQRVQRYRMVFVLDRPLMKVKEFKEYLFEGMYMLFPEADRCHATQVWAGGKGYFYLNETFRLSPEHLMNAAHAYSAKSAEKPQSKSRIFKKLLEPLPPALFQGRFFEFGADGNESGSKPANGFNIYKPSDTNELLRNYDWGRARRKFKLLDDFLSCRRKIWHVELRGLYSGMKRIRGGKKKWRDAVRANPLIDDVKIVEIAKWVFI
ncbi:hypothetical protein H6777_04035 [Candidatus Nomurabacteria bacterium]|nr:hypothetical protein [Candidatus Nomurabacteria bacterium]